MTAWSAPHICGVVYKRCRDMRQRFAPLLRQGLPRFALPGPLSAAASRCRKLVAKRWPAGCRPVRPQYMDVLWANPGACSRSHARMDARVTAAARVSFLWLLSFGQAKESNRRPWMADDPHTDVSRSSRVRRKPKSKVKMDSGLRRNDEGVDSGLRRNDEGVDSGLRRNDEGVDSGLRRNDERVIWRSPKWRNSATWRPRMREPTTPTQAPARDAASDPRRTSK